MEVTLDEGRNFSADCPTLLLPGLSIGNVGQLAVDLLISSSAAQRVAFLDHPSVLPCVGNDAYGPLPNGNLALSLEAYESQQQGLVFIQQRSPVIKGTMILFAKSVAAFASSIDKKHIIVLSSLDAGKRKKIDASSDMQVCYVSNAHVDGTDADCEKIGLKRLEEYDPAQRRWRYLNDLAEGKVVQDDEITDEDEFVDDDYFAGLPFAALFSFCKAVGVKVTCLLCYCSEGDNIADSFQLAQVTCNLLKLNPENFSGNGQGWVIPLSWQTVYGPPPDMSLF